MKHSKSFAFFTRSQCSNLPASPSNMSLLFIKIQSISIDRGLRYLERKSVKFSKIIKHSSMMLIKSVSLIRA